MRSFQRLMWLLFILCVGAMTIFCMFLRSSLFAADRKPIANRRLSEEEGSARIVSYEAHLLERGFTSEQIRNMSSLGKWLLAPEESPPPAKANTSYLILMWKHWQFLERRHIRRFSSSKKFSPWDRCSVQNCALSHDEKDLHRADAVLFHLHRTRGVWTLPVRDRTDQRWIFLTDETPLHTFLTVNGQRLSDYDGLFNWSMSYRMDSDVPVPYGRTVRRRQRAPQALWYRSSRLLERSRETDSIISKTKLVAVMGSNCSGKNRRWFYVKALKRLLRDDLDIFGRCLNGNRTICPGRFDRDCPALTEYKFYLSFENSNCREYLTEKVFWNAYHKRAVPIIMGASRADCLRLLPPRSFLHVDDFASIDALADYLRYLARNDERYLRYHEWRDRYRTIDEHGYFGSASKHFCRVCEALNYNLKTPRVYERLEDFWSAKRDCVDSKVNTATGWS